ncbi:hypothetical protein KY290_019711 [Solanum tuberosum]|uniref:Uncharacterized protein n=1 Tax=Solanum tuberosum TaxID=4113 RepID=A0ABQ7VHT2_SOLTU|nr:hypothetical protein KY290_019711 [Solanum tuberosum]
MATLKSYTDEVKDTIIDALKANLKGVTDLTSIVENEEDEILGENNSNQPCENSVSSGQKNKDDNLCEHVASLELSMMEVVAFIRDEKLRRAQKNKKNEAIVDKDLIAEEVNEQDEKREEEKLEENEEEIEEKLEEKKQEEKEEEQTEENKEEEKKEEQIKKKEEEKKKEEKIEENKEQEKEEEQIELQEEEEKEQEKLEEKVDEVLAEEGKEGSDENSVDMMGIVMELNGEKNGDE